MHFVLQHIVMRVYPNTEENIKKKNERRYLGPNKCQKVTGLRFF